jgi:hypothetical protein
MTGRRARTALPAPLRHPSLPDLPSPSLPAQGGEGSTCVVVNWPPSTQPLGDAPREIRVSYDWRTSIAPTNRAATLLARVRNLSR